MRRAALALLVTFVLAACSAPTGPAPQPFVVPTADPAAVNVAPTLTAEQEALFGPRVELPGGLLLKQLGKVAQWGGPEDSDPNTWGIRVVLDEVSVDPACDEFSPEPARGHKLVLKLRIETSSLYQPTTDDGPFFYRWSVTGPDGVTENSANVGALCNTADELSFDLRPSAQYRGQVVLDSRYDSGQLVLDNLFAWDFPHASA